MENLSGSVERVTYYNAENGYSVIRLRPKERNIPGRNHDGLVTLVGNLPALSPGEHLKLRGKWTKHPKHGLQFQVEHCQQTAPATLTGIRRYLGSGLIKGIGPKLAESIVERFGKETLEIISEHPERLSEVEKIGSKRTTQIAQAWEDQKHIKEIMLFLHSHGVSTNLATKIYKTYQDESLQIVQDNPYQLARDIYGVGFKTADKLAQNLGLEADHPSRLEAGLVYALSEQTNDGHVYFPEEELIQKASHLLEIPVGDLKPALERLLADEQVVADMLPLSPPPGEKPGPRAVRESPGAYLSPAVYLPPFYYSEIGVSRRLKSLLAAEPLARQGVTSPGLDPTLSAEQRQAVETSLSHPVSVLTGGPGTGKTTAVRSLISALEEAGKKYALASPTGRAAKRLSQATDRPASTIHRLLGFSPLKGFTHNHKNPLMIDFLVVDEASMLDVILGNHLLKALQPGAHLLLVGDVDQLPSVGAGDVLRDVIASGRVPITRLSTIFRQESDSHIISNAHRMNQGQMPFFPKQSGDFFLFPAQDAESAGDWVVDVTCNRIPQKFGLHPRDIQVLSPLYRGAAGVHALNARLQATLNPPRPNKPEESLYGQIFRAGDKVMQIKNDYDKLVYNGDIGYIASMDAVEKTLVVNFEGRPVQYDWVECEQLVHAYAVSVHKAQGSEFPAVVIPVITQHYMMLQRNLLYTAITRAQKLCVLAGNRRAIAIAVHNNKVAERYTALDWRLTL